MLNRDRNRRIRLNGSSDADASNPNDLAMPCLDAGEGAENGDACSQIQANLAAFEDGELTGEQAHRVKEHVADCPRCVSTLEALREQDRLISWEWRESAPLPFSGKMRHAVDSIMSALPPAETQGAFAPRRIHVRGRWSRLAAGLISMVAMAGLAWSSYCVGYTRGRQSVVRPVAAPEAPAIGPRVPSPQSGISARTHLSSIASFPSSLPPPPTRISSLPR
jgi:anti-sigma factor RsiW